MSTLFDRLKMVMPLRTAAVSTALFIAACSAQAGFAGFEVGDGLPMTGGIVRVNYMGNKSHTISLGPHFQVRLMEVQITYAGGETKRHTMVYAGDLALRAPLAIEWVEILGPLFVLTLLFGVIFLLSSTFRFMRATRGTAPEDDSGGLSESPRTGDGSPSVSSSETNPRSPIPTPR